MIMINYLMNKKDLILWNNKNKKMNSQHKGKMYIINYYKRSKKNIKKK